MRRLIFRILATIGGAVVGAVLLGLAGRYLWRGHVPARTVVEVDLERPLVEYVPDEPLANLLQSRRTPVREVLDGLARAKADDHVVALLAHVGQGARGLAQLQELRDAVTDFRGSGKRAIAFTEAFGEAGPGNGAYYLASAFGEIYLQPSGDVGLTGLLAEAPFVRGTLDKLGIVARFAARGEYKNAINMFTERRFTEPHRQATTRLITSQFDQIVRGIASGRGLSENDVRAIVDRAPLSAQEAMDAKLVDGLAYRDEVLAKLETGGAKPERLSLARYLALAGLPSVTGDTVALIHGVGVVTSGKSGVDPMSGDVGMGSETLGEAFRSAVEADRVRAILFRIDSPGGSYVASDSIWREVTRARESGKPVIVSMSDVAASGGYFVAMPADRIVAQPGTITGSIGVFSGKMLTGGLWDKLGVTWDEVHIGTNATMWTGLSDYTPSQRANLDGTLDRIYQDFTSKVAVARKLPKERVEEIARGRIWSGEDALARGLVDALGGYPEALRQVRSALGLPADAPIHLEQFPPARGLLGSLVARAVGPGDDANDEDPSVAAVRAGVEAVQAVTRSLRAIGLGEATISGLR
ncbi:MAG TPA: S49 family peptidase [Candidatus Binatia bacterium]|nr:S49 family peptidase [Candidatus Binatia bacterium]